MAKDTMYSSEWFNERQGRDAPKELSKFLNRECVIGFENSTLIQGRVRFILDSQTPRIALSVTGDSPLVVLGFETCHVECEVEDSRANQDSKNIQELRQLHPRWFAAQGKLARVKVMHTCHVEIGQPSKLSEESRRKWDLLCDNLILQSLEITMQCMPKWQKSLDGVFKWLDMLQQKIHSYMQPQKSIEGSKKADEDDEDDEARIPKAFWHFYEHSAPTENDKWHAMPPYPWLQEETGKYIHLDPIAPYFIDDHERRMRLINAMMAERRVQELAVTSIFDFDKIHSMTIRDTPTQFYHVHVRITETDGLPLVVPEIGAGCKAKIKLGGNFDDEVKGTVIDAPTDMHLVIAVKKVELEGHFIESAMDAKIKIKPNLHPVEQQIEAIQKASQEDLVYGDKQSNKGKGFSLRKTVLAHGSELDPSHSDFFTLSVTDLSPLSAEVIQERLDYMKNVFSLDPTQHEAYNNSLMKIIAGISLIQGPPGTGKTHVAVAIILTAACLNIKVLLAAGSNKAVDNLLNAIVKLLESHPKLAEWCGPLARAKTSAYQMSLVRRESSIESVRDQCPVPETDSENRLWPYQMPNLVQNYAQEIDTKFSREFLQHQQQDKDTGLPEGQVRFLKSAYEVVVSQYVREKASVVATTLTNSAHESLDLFKPDMVVCDDSGQCVEGDHMIALTRYSVKAVVLLGDPEQLPPTIISGSDTNSEIGYAQRSLMQRLQTAKYPCTMLSTNYRCHPLILDLFNQTVYHGKLEAAEANKKLERVGRSWESYARQNVQMFGPTFALKRRVFISCPGRAVQEPDSASFVNYGQIDVALSLASSLQSHVTAEGERIKPSDIMFISPYRQHKDALERIAMERKVEYNENLTVDSAQGQEASIVIYMLVKPNEKNPESFGFVANKNRMNVALSRATKLLFIIGNLDVWNDKFQRNARTKNTSATLLLNLLKDVSIKKDVVKWSSVTSQRLTPNELTLNKLTLSQKPQRPAASQKRRERSPGDTGVESSHQAKRPRPENVQAPVPSVTVPSGEESQANAPVIVDTRVGALVRAMTEVDQRFQDFEKADDWLRSSRNQGYPVMDSLIDRQRNNLRDAYGRFRNLGNVHSGLGRSAAQMIESGLFNYVEEKLGTSGDDQDVEMEELEFDQDV
jgi:ATP-dependent RNA/DNA helicase IGHMBP2